MNRDDFIGWCAAERRVLIENPGFSPLIMGIINATPDSCYGGRYANLDAAYEHAQLMIAAGADIIDIGGESSRPGSTPISAEEELERVLPVLERIHAAHPIALSVDTCKPEVMRAAISAGAACINDIHALQMPGAIDAVLSEDVAICLMHMQGVPLTMQDAPYYPKDVVEDIDAFFVQRIEACENAGILRSRLILDPGFGFGKTVQHNLQAVRRIQEFQRHDLPILLGASRKSTIGKVLNQPPEGRMVGGLALAIYAMLVGVSIIRTHDVMETKQAFKMLQEMNLSTGVAL